MAKFEIVLLRLLYISFMSLVLISALKFCVGNATLWGINIMNP